MNTHKIQTAQAILTRLYEQRSADIQSKFDALNESQRFWDAQIKEANDRLLTLFREMDAAPTTTCRHCFRTILQDSEGVWIDPEAADDDSVWRETCDSHDTFQAEHEPC